MGLSTVQPFTIKEHLVFLNMEIPLIGANVNELGNTALVAEQLWPQSGQEVVENMQLCREEQLGSACGDLQEHYTHTHTRYSQLEKRRHWKSQQNISDLFVT